VTELAAACPACGADGLEGFHEQRGVPANSCLLLESRDEAVAFPTGEMQLGFCPRCGFITNTRFDPALAEYSDRYEETQAFSDRFVTFARSLAKRWVERYDLAGKSVLEIGCGKGEFLVMMAEAGIGRGIGIDPGVHPERIDTPVGDRLEWIADFYSDEYAHLEADVVVCRHTLEHIGPVGEFVRMIRRNIGDRLDTVVLFELPDVQRVLDEVAFWDVYYEHCSYFSAGSLARLFERSGFEVLDLFLDYDDQYLILEARPVAAGTTPKPWPADDMDGLRRGVERFRAGYETTIGHWTKRLTELRDEGGTAVIWGAGSKGVAFLAVAGADVAAAVDINPFKHGMYMAGTGHRIVPPAELPALRPDLVIAMNPIYVDEIRGDLDELGLPADLDAV
jgi:SAM-dependent methyltransferase